jgi:hypothetical protein
VGDSGKLHVKKNNSHTKPIKQEQNVKKLEKLYFERGVCVCCGGEHIIEKKKKNQFQFKSSYVTKEKYLEIFYCVGTNTYLL